MEDGNEDDDGEGGNRKSGKSKRECHAEALEKKSWLVGMHLTGTGRCQNIGVVVVMM
jgi:hypothetical protein